MVTIARWRLPSPPSGPEDANTMEHKEPHHVRLRESGLALALSVAGLGVAAIFGALWISGAPMRPTPKELNSGLTAALTSSMAEVMTGVLGLSLTVVAIVVQLAAQRYPAKIVDLFMRDRTSVGVFTFMIVSCVYIIVAPLATRNGEIPNAVTILALVLMLANFGLLLPYFQHVFAFLEPNNIITRISDTGKKAFALAQRPGQLELAQQRIAQAIERISDNSVAAIDALDRNLALHTVRTLEALAAASIKAKPGLPEGWARFDPLFLGTLSDEFIEELGEGGAWVEAKLLMEFDRILRHALGSMSELVSQIATSTRVLGQHAHRHGDAVVLDLVVQFFNTYMRHTLNRRDVRSAYNILYEYRLLAADLLHGAPELAERIAEHMVYYGRTANSMGLGFVTVTAAHDVRLICEEAIRGERPRGEVEGLIERLLQLDQPSDNDQEEAALLGVRRAQAILGAFLLERGDEVLAEAIRQDMCMESAGRLRATRDAILAVRERKFWEITDRGFNFDYVPPESHPHIHAFFDPLLR